MKKILYSSIASMATLYGCAQSPVIDRFGGSTIGKVENAYYKDVNGLLNQYVGTWIYSNGNTTLKIIFIKKPMTYVSSFKNYYEDYLVGEFQYIENGVEKVNTLPNLSASYSDIMDYNLFSVAMMKKDSYPLCPECGEDERRLLMFFNEPSRRNIWNGISNNFVIRKFIQNGQEKLKVQFVYTGNGLETLNSPDGQFTNINSFNVPYGEYILTKQP
ncbi:hypothetical protein E6C50_08820 [Flavobacterium supellecticarium]|uniref:DUF6705 domain-containing protein n=1 Tax=Flavobacterium supellecticarium TaxID=2565924 RepID=A0A4S4A0R1_9FLAO|nr:DUF6705 family protein [Flavobacterium supellecticarium]THF51845.1 hypothetical protein E6C50_08820 [Flavobacterium supellecticarium]